MHSFSKRYPFLQSNFIRTRNGCWCINFFYRTKFEFCLGRSKTFRLFFVPNIVFRLVYIYFPFINKNRTFIRPCLCDILSRIAATAVGVRTAIFFFSPNAAFAETQTFPFFRLALKLLAIGFTSASFNSNSEFSPILILPPPVNVNSHRDLFDVLRCFLPKLLIRANFYPITLTF